MPLGSMLVEGQGKQQEWAEVDSGPRTASASPTGSSAEKLAEELSGVGQDGQTLYLHSNQSLDMGQHGEACG